MAAHQAILLAFAILSGVIGVAVLLAAVLSFATDSEGDEIPSYLWIPGVDFLWVVSAPFVRWRKISAGRTCVYSGMPFLAVSMLLLTLR